MKLSSIYIIVHTYKSLLELSVGVARESPHAGHCGKPLNSKYAEACEGWVKEKQTSFSPTSPTDVMDKISVRAKDSVTSDRFLFE